MADDQTRQSRDQDDHEDSKAPPAMPTKDTGESRQAETLEDSRLLRETPATHLGSFGRYKIEKCLGEGGMGSVYLARDETLDRQVALKVPKLTGKNPERVFKRFLREARAAAGLQHRNICPVFDIGDVDGQPYIAMAYIEGRPLADFIRPKRPVKPRKAAIVVRKIALALEEAHSQGIIHRDLKPANVMIDQKNEPVVMDFGLAGHLESTPDDSRLTKDGAILGTPTYMPPEQVDGEIQKIGPQSDIYSLGVIFYEMVRGRPPFEGSMASVLGQVVMKAPEPLSMHVDDLPHELDTLCMSMLAKQPEGRPESMQEVADGLASFLKMGATETNISMVAPPVQSTDIAEPIVTLPSADTTAAPEPSVGISPADITIRDSDPVRRVHHAPRHPKSTLLFVGGGVAAAVILLTTLVLVFAFSGADPDDSVAAGSDASERSDNDEQSRTRPLIEPDDDSDNSGSTGDGTSDSDVDGTIGEDHIGSDTTPLVNGDDENGNDDAVGETTDDGNSDPPDSDPMDSSNGDSDVATNDTENGDRPNTIEATDGTPLVGIQTTAVVIAAIEESNGLVGDDFAFCQTMPLDDYDVITLSLSEAGYRPVRFRPFMTGTGPRVAAIWHRLPGAWEIAGPLTLEEIQAQHIRFVSQGMCAIDACGYFDAEGNPQYFGVWTDGWIQNGPTIATWGQSDPVFDEVRAEFQEIGFIPQVFHLLRPTATTELNTAIYHKDVSGFGYYKYFSRDAFDAKHRAMNQYRLVDLSVWKQLNRESYCGSWASTWAGQREEYNLEAALHEAIETTRTLSVDDYYPVSISTWIDSVGDTKTAMIWRKDTRFEDRAVDDAGFAAAEPAMAESAEWLVRGQVYFDQNDFNRAMYCFSKSIDLDGNADAITKRAELCRAYSLEYAAIADLDSVIESGAPSNLYVERALCHIEVSNWEEARSDLAMAVRKDSENVEALRAFARLLAIADSPVFDADRSRQYARQAFALDESEATRFVLVLAHAADMDRENVELQRKELFATAEGLAMQSDLHADLEYLLRRPYGRALVRFENRDYGRAIEDLQNVTAVHPHYELAWFYLGRCHLGNADYAEAVAAFQECLDLNPSSVWANYNQGFAYFHLDQYSQAIDVLTIAIDGQSEGSPDTVSPLYWRARCYLMEGDLEQAVEDLEKAVRADSSHFSATELLARILCTAQDDNVRDGARALELAVKAVELSEGRSAGAFETQAAAYAENGQFVDATASMQFAVGVALASSNGDGQSIAEQMMRNATQFGSGRPMRESTRQLGERPYVRQ